MEDNKITLDIENFSVVKEVSDEQFAIVELYVCHAGNNLHNMPIKLATLKKAASTLKNKYLVAGFDGDDFEGHEPDEMIVGHFPESGKISYKKKDGRTYLVAEAIMSKIYADWAYEQFVTKNHRGVSMEISVTKLGEKDSDGLQEIKEFVFNGVTILGDGHTPACEGADASIIKFSVENASKFYSKYSWKSNVIVQNFVDSMGVETGKEGTENMEEKAIVNEEVEAEVTETVEVTVEETNEPVEVEVKDETTGEEVFEDSNDTDESDDSVTMEEDDDKDDSEDSDKDDGDDEEDKDEDKDEEGKDESKGKEFESLTVEQKHQVFQAACKDKGLGWVESFDDEYIYCYDYNEGYVYRYSYTLDGTEVTISDEKVRVMRGGYVPFEAEKEAEEVVATEDTVAEESAEAENATNPEVEALQEENAKLKATIADYEEEKKSFEIEKILTSVLDSLTPEQVNELREDAKNFTLDNLNDFSNKVKALAFESVKGKSNKYSFAKIAVASVTAEPATTGKYSW